jgi:hypothetical protein
MKFRVEESISKVDVKFDDLMKIMSKIIINVDKLINCVFFLNDQDNSKSS